jgi:hypothetical protein
VEQSFVLPGSAFDETGVAQLILQGGRYGGWKVGAQHLGRTASAMSSAACSATCCLALLAKSHPGAEHDAIDAPRL